MMSQKLNTAEIKKLRDRPVFICGHPKSGTSLMRSLLDSHPQLVVYPEESVFFRRYLKKTQGMGMGDKLAATDQYITHIFTWNQENPPESQAGFPDRDYSQISFEAVQRQRILISDTAGIRHDGDYLSASVLAYGEVAGQLTGNARYWVEKSPYNELFAPQIFSWWPEAKCIHIVRDPRDNYASYQRKHEDWQAEFFAYNWYRSTEAGFKNLVRYGADRYRLIRFEDLLQKPKDTLVKIRVFLGIEDDDALKQPARAGENWQGNSMFDDKFSGISAAPIGRWRETLDQGDACVIQLINSRFMRELEYLMDESFNLGAYWRVGTWRLRQKIAALGGNWKDS